MQRFIGRKSLILHTQLVLMTLVGGDSDFGTFWFPENKNDEAITRWKNFNNMLSCFDTTQHLDGETDRQRDTLWQHCAEKYNKQHKTHRQSFTALCCKMLQYHTVELLTMIQGIITQVDRMNNSITNHLINSLLDSTWSCWHHTVTKSNSDDTGV